MKAKRYLPIGYKLLVSCVFLIIVPVVSVGFFSIATFSNTLKVQTTKSMTETLEQIRRNIEYKLIDIRRLSDLLYFDNTLADYVSRYGEEWDSYENRIKYIVPKFQNTVNATSQKVWLSVYLANDSFPERYTTLGMRSDPLASMESSVDIFHLSRIENEPWYERFPEEQYGVTAEWRQIGLDAKYGNISLLRRLIDTTDPTLPTSIGFMRITAKIESLFQSIDYQKLGEGTVYHVVDERNQVIYASSKNSVQSLTIDEGDGRQLTLSQPLDNTDWRLIAQVPMTALEKDAGTVTRLTVVICLISFAVCLIASIFVSRFFSKRVGKVVSVLNSFQEGHFEKRMKYKGYDEFREIAAALDEVGQNTDRLIKEVYLAKIEKQELEFESLQAQIHPHFLYNTLSSINRLAKFGELDKLQRMVMELSKFYRLSLSKGKTVISVENELEQAKSYVEIQKIKYRDRLEAEYRIDPEALPYSTVKLILQPFIENAIEHAWTGENRIHIEIETEKMADGIVFRVIDNGSGMPEETIAQIFSPQDGVYLGYGIRNVDQRIKLHFGVEFGVSITSEPGAGTRVEIVIPALV